MSVMARWSIVALAACATTSRATFRITDPTFVPAPGQTPPVFTSTESEIPSDARRSVGIIEVHTDSEARAAEIAAAKGRELGCTILIEHRAYERLRAQLGSGGQITLAHGAPHLPPKVTPPTTTYRFHCVVRGPRTTLATST